jgi:hypothetical protein
MLSKLELATEPNATGLGSLPAFVGASTDQLTLEFRQAT